jgi:hypothetical protein
MRLQLDSTMGAERAAAVEKRVTNSALQMMDRWH